MIQVRKWLEKQLWLKMAAECQVLTTRDDVRWRLVARDAHNTRALWGREEEMGLEHVARWLCLSHLVHFDKLLGGWRGAPRPEK